MENDTFIEEYSNLTIDEKIMQLYEYTFIHSLIFTFDFRDYLNEAGIDGQNYSIILESLRRYLSKNQHIFDDSLKKNFYSLMDYVASNDTKTNLNDKNSIINEMKLNLNNIVDINNIRFLRYQILVRDYGIFNYYWNKLKVRRISEQAVLNSRRTYYNSMSNDFSVIHLLISSDEFFMKIISIIYCLMIFTEV